MKKFACLLLVPALWGCFSAQTPTPVSYWLLEYRGVPSLSHVAKFGSGRLSQVVVDMPYANDRLVVLKDDGSLAFDAHNLFASSPVALLKSVGLKAMEDSGLFTSAVEAASGMSTHVSVEIVVHRFVLDCRGSNSRRAVAALTVRVLEGRNLLASTAGEGAADAADGNYGEAFSKAVSLALASAFDKLK